MCRAHLPAMLSVTAHRARCAKRAAVGRTERLREETGPTLNTLVYLMLGFLKSIKIIY